MNIEKKIALLPPEKREEFHKALIDVCESKPWCTDHGIDYLDRDVLKIREIFFKEEYESHLPHPKN